MSPAQIAERLHALAALKIHPRDQTENTAALARAERLYAEHLGEIRRLIEEHTMAFEAVLQRQEPREIEAFRQRFTAFLNELDRQTYF